jgi:multimeric flavodoxin WrbA
MQVLVIMGSPRKGNTCAAAQQIEKEMQTLGNYTFEYLMLGDRDLARCRGCYVCFARGEEHCPIRDDAPAIEAQMHAADGVIFATPVYGMNVSGLMKTFVDRFSYIFHRPRFFDKKAFLLTTTGAIGHREVLDYLDLVARVWGFEIAGRAALITPPLTLPERRIRENETIVREAARRFHEALTRQGRKSPSLRDVILFHGQRAAFIELGDVSPVDYAYWNEMGWFGKEARYFVDVPVNPLYHAVGGLFEWYLRRQVRKERAEARGLSG